MQIELKPLKEEHAQISYKWRNDEDVWKYTGSKPNKKITLQDELNWIREVLKRENEKRYAIIVNNQYVGNIQLTDITGETAQFHIFIGDKNFWGKNIGTVATKLMLENAKKIKLKKIYLEVNKKNLSAIKVYEKNGFIQIKENDSKIYMELELNLQEI